jgi:hypothetical protein
MTRIPQPLSASQFQASRLIQFYNKALTPRKLDDYYLGQSHQGWSIVDLDSADDKCLLVTGRDHQTLVQLKERFKQSYDTATFDLFAKQKPSTDWMQANYEYTECLSDLTDKAGLHPILSNLHQINQFLDTLKLSDKA